MLEVCRALFLMVIFIVSGLAIPPRNTEQQFHYTENTLLYILHKVIGLKNNKKIVLRLFRCIFYFPLLKAC